MVCVLVIRHNLVTILRLLQFVQHLRISPETLSVTIKDMKWNVDLGVTCT
jgi:hypothetical protein